MSKRILAMMLVLFVAFASLPMPMLTYAEIEQGEGDGGELNQENNNQEVTLTVNEAGETEGELVPIEGATVCYALGDEAPAQEEDWIEVSGTTDEKGKITVLAANQETVSAESATYIWLKVSKFGYNTNELDESARVELAVFENENQKTEAAVTLVKKQLITEIEETYNKSAFTLAALNEDFLNEIKDKFGEDVIDKYAVQTLSEVSEGTELAESAWEESVIPKRTDADTYVVYVKVERVVDVENGTVEVVWEESVTSVIKKATVTGIEITANENIVYNGNAHELVTLTGGNLLENATVNWKVNGENYDLPAGDNVPKKEFPGIYVVTLEVDFGNNYVPFISDEISVNIANGSLDITGLTVEGYSGEYDGVSHEAIVVSGQGDYTLYYQLHTCGSLNCDDHEIEQNQWTTDVPKVINAGSYIVWVKAGQEHYNDKDVPVTPAQYAVEPFNVYISKGTATLLFKNENYTPNDSIEVLNKGLIGADGLKYNFAAEYGNELSDGITYSVVEQIAADTWIETQKATIDGNGELTINDAGTYKVTATLSNENYIETSINYTVKVTMTPENDGDFVVFKDDAGVKIEKIDYELSAIENDKITELKAVNVNQNDKGTITYSYDIDLNEIGISGNEQGVLIVSEYEKVAQALLGDEEHAIEIIVTATKSADVDWNEDIRYAADETSYKVIVKFAEIPENPYELSVPTGTKGWYKEGDILEVKAPDGYTISKEVTDFVPSVIFNDEGCNERFVYLKSSSDGKIIGPIKVVDSLGNKLGIDTKKPDKDKMEIIISGLEIPGKSPYIFGSFQAPVTITFKINDEFESDGEAGLKYITWKYEKDEKASSSIQGNTEGQQLSVNEVDGAYVATLTLPASQAEQLRGKISFTATDNAGNESESVKNETIIVGDSQDSILKAKHELANGGNYNTEGKQHYYSNDVKFTFELREANFFSEDANVDVTKDGKSYDCQVTWTQSTENDEIYYGTFTLSEEGDYIVSMDYRDNSGNKLVYQDNSEIAEHKYESEVITIDRTVPVLGFVYDEKTSTMKFTVKEHNFSSKAISLSGTITDINGNAINGFSAESIQKTLRDAKWTNEGQDTYTYTLTSCADGIYNLDINYKDLALLSATEVDKQAKFVFDRTAPTNVKIGYSKSLLDTILENITFGFYKGDVTVTFTAYDYAAGVKSFTWKYTKQNDVSEINRNSDETSAVLEAVQDVNNESEFTATITLPNTDEKQLRGYLAAYATDNYDNASQTVTDSGHIIVVDSIAPTLKAEYSVANKIIGNASYYNSDAEVTFTVTEANFYKEDLEVTIIKNGGTSYAVVPNWTDVNADTHVGKYVLSEEGDYVITVNYTDRSTNKMNTYVSNTITIDKTAPVLGFTFNKTSQTLKFTVKEHNFRAQDISVSGSITDINGNAINAYSAEFIQNTLRNAVWTDEGNDTYTYTLSTCPDGIYDLDINYKDIALQDAKTNAPEVFIIDRTAPVNVKIDYSKSLFDTVLEKITFGFYKGSATITFTAYDYAAGVKEFTWNYTKENGVSDVNRNTDEKAATVKAVQDATDKSKFTATVELPNTDEKQLRGYLAVLATDTYTNSSKKVTDSGHIVVVDSIAPTMKVEYSAADKIKGNMSYYNNDVEVTFTVTEANFYAEDVKVTVTKDGGTAYAVTPKWSDVNTDTHVGTYKLSKDGDYVITVKYTDRSTNNMKTYVSKTITIDTVKPVVKVEYKNKDVVNTLKDSAGKKRKYFADTQTAVITITEHNFNENDVVFNIIAKDVSGAELKTDKLLKKSKWQDGTKKDTHVLTITYSGDANYTFDVEYADLATNAIKNYKADYFTVDNTAPVDLNVSYSTSVFETILEAITFGFYNAKADVTLTANDDVSGVHGFKYSYTKADGVSEVNAELINQKIAASEINYSADGKTATVQFKIPNDILTAESQFNGTISFAATNRAGLKNTFKDNKRIVVDNIAPTAQVTYNEPVNKEGTISYYDGDVNATVVITEANFYASDVVVTVSKDGGVGYAVSPTWLDNSTDVHTGTFTLTEDGDYIITINYRDKSSNAMIVYTSEQLTIDTEILLPTIKFNDIEEDRNGYKEEVVPSIEFKDVNYDTYEVHLYRTYKDSIGVDLTEQKGIKNLFSISEEAGNAKLNIFGLNESGKYNPEDDGIYHLEVEIWDKAGHSIKKEADFTINRYGSVYEYKPYLTDLIANGGSYKKEITDDLIITEYNAEKLVADSLNIEITRDGKPLENVEYTANISEDTLVGNSGWYQYEYVISKNNFKVDGIYKISVSSKDIRGNSPENSNFEDKNILFYVDSAAPEITSITGLEKTLVDATEKEINYTIYDAIGLKLVQLYVDGKVVQEISDFTEDLNNYSGKYILEESEDERTIRIVAVDMAENIIDTGADTFTSAYTFNETVMVTTNDFVRFFANKPLFYGTIGGTVGIAGVAAFGIRRFRLKRRSK